MKQILGILIFLSAGPAWAADSNAALCQSLYDKANSDPQSSLKSQDPDKQMQEILDGAGMVKVLADAIPVGVKKKMSWSDLKAYVKKKNKIELSDIFEPQYDDAYFKAHCASSISQAQAFSTDTHNSAPGLFDNTNPTILGQSGHSKATTPLGEH